MSNFKPCKSHVTNKDGEVWYCEVGEEGHWGTCIGGKSRVQYELELRAWNNRRKRRDGRSPS